MYLRNLVVGLSKLPLTARMRQVSLHLVVALFLLALSFVLTGAVGSAHVGQSCCNIISINASAGIVIGRDLKIRSTFQLNPDELDIEGQGVGNAVKKTDAQQRSAASHLSSEHRVVVEQWLAQKPELRLAADSDYAYKESLTAERAAFKNYHPYYAVGDFNGDRRADFAIALINTQERMAKFAIAVFNGPFRKESLPAFFREGYDLRRKAFTVADGIENARRSTLFAEDIETGKGLILRVGRKGYFLGLSETDFN